MVSSGCVAAGAVVVVAARHQHASRPDRERGGEPLGVDGSLHTDSDAPEAPAVPAEQSSDPVGRRSTDRVKRVHRVEGVVRHYAWGDPAFLPRLLGAEPDGRPWAELWLGTHPDGPSQLADGGSLVDLTGELPYLLKVLAVAEPLSLQAHPDAAQAIDGFERGMLSRRPTEARTALRAHPCRGVLRCPSRRSDVGPVRRAGCRPTRPCTRSRRTGSRARGAVPRPPRSAAGDRCLRLGRPSRGRRGYATWRPAIHANRAWR